MTRQVRTIPRVRTIFSLLLMAAFTSPALAQPFEAVGSRALGMAGAFVAVADDPSGAYWNPAGLASGQPAGATIEWSRLQNGDRKAAPSSGPWEQSTRFTSLGTWPMGLSYTRVDDVSLGAEGRVDRFTTQHYGLTVLQTITEGLVIGSTLKYVRGSVGTALGAEAATVGDALKVGRSLGVRTSGAFDLDLSAMLDARTFRIGYTIRNLRSPEFDDGIGTFRELERRSRVGLAVLPTSGLTLAIDLDLDTADRPTGPQRVIAAGAEHQFSRIAFRAGVRRNLEGTRATVGAAGASVAVRPGTWLDAHVTLGRSSEERGFGIGLRAGW